MITKNYPLGYNGGHRGYRGERACDLRLIPPTPSNAGDESRSDSRHQSVHTAGSRHSLWVGPSTHISHRGIAAASLSKQLFYGADQRNSIINVKLDKCLLCCGCSGIKTIINGLEFVSNVSRY